MVVASPESPMSTEGVIETKFVYESIGPAMPGFGPGSQDSADLRSSFQQLSEDCSSLRGAVDGSQTNPCSPTLDACRDSLRTDMASMLYEANLLLENGEKVTSWRASLAQARVDSYLETIQSALDSRDQWDNELGLVANSIATQINSETKTADDLPVRVSSWRTPSLCFDLEVGEPVQFIRKEKMPIKVRVRAIAEIHAKDINSNSIPKYTACRIHVEEVKHDERSLFSLAGDVGEAAIKIRISPLGDDQKKKPTWGEDEDVGFVRVKEARIVQKNAYPPLPKRTVDLYTSSHHGSSDTTVMLRFKTHRVLEAGDDVAEVDIELVMDSS